jgi:hypothetical protein
MKKEIKYQLMDDSGINIIQVQILIPINTIFEHEYGIYEVDEIVEDKYTIAVFCQRISERTKL